MISTLLTILCVLPSIFAKPLNNAPPQSLSQPSLDFAPLTPISRPSSQNLTAGHVEVGCFKPDKPWARTNKADCETALDYWVRGEDLTVLRLFSKNPNPRSRIRPMHLPISIYSDTCFIWINVLKEGDEEVTTMADIYANALGPDGVAKNCLGQNGNPAIGGKMLLGENGLLAVSLSGRK